MFKLEKIDYTNVGGPMGTDTTSVIWEKYFTSKELAKKYAKTDHSTHKTQWPIVWNEKYGCVHSGDLRSHAYEIRKIDIEE